MNWIKDEFIAEAVVYSFFEFIVTQKCLPIKVYEVLGTGKLEGKNLSFEKFCSELGIKGPEAIEPCPLNNYFTINHDHPLIQNNGLTLDSGSGFDCGLKDINSIVGIEVKSGKSQKYDNINATLNYSRKAKNLINLQNGQCVEGDMINIYSCIDKGFLKSKENRELAGSWILIINNTTQLRASLSPKNHQAFNNLKYVFTLEEIYSYVNSNESLKEEIYKTLEISLKRALKFKAA